MRIGFVSTSYPRFEGDWAGNFVAEMAQEFAREGHSLEVIAATPHRQPSKGAEATKRAIPLHLISSPPGLFYEGGAPESLHSNPSLRKILGAAGFSLRLGWRIRSHSKEWQGIVAHWLAPSTLASIVNSPRKVPVWAIAHGGDVHLLRRLGLCSWTLRLLASRRYHLQFVSHSLRETFAEGLSNAKLVGALFENSSVVPMGVNLSHFQGIAEKRRERVGGGQGLGSDSSSGGVRLLFLGRLEKIKGLDLLIRGIGALSEKEKALLQLSVGGDGAEKKSLHRLSQELGVAVRWLGELTSLGRDQALGETDWVVLPSREQDGRSEGMPRVALEAWASGASILAARSGGLAELPKGVASFFEPDSVSSLVDGLRGCLASPPLNQVIAPPKQSEAALHELDWAHCCRPIYDFF